MGYPSLDLKDKTAVVIGGTSGIGRTVALGLAEAGANVVATGRREEMVKSVTQEIQSRGRRSIAVPCDVMSISSIENFHQSVLKEFGSVQILVNCAGTTKRRPSLEVSDEEWNSILETNLTGLFRTCRTFGKHMIEQKYGRIINVGSISSFVGLYEVAAYGASKGAVALLTKSLAVEWSKHGVCVNALAPGVFRTELNAGLLDGTERGREFLMRTPMKRFGQLEELVGAVVFLASDAASFVTGHVLVVDGGLLASGVNQ
jgi:NAD(P)-dependent dehydrogenase (short-subunit alcohol dehydrogenase family)